jgi:pyruvate/2-oxoglutarate dehydrogenase complex dihydrolipoamide acyltransferase (E2) component
MVSRRDVEKELGISSNKSFGHKKSTADDVLIPVDLEKVTVKKISGNKRKEIEYLSQVQSSGLTSTLHTYIDTDGIFAHINQHSQYFKNALLPLIIFEVARLLLKYKELNAYFTGDSIAYYKTVNIGFAIDLDKGLKVLKVANADAKFINEIENDILELSNRYLDDQLKVEDLTDISFTITDLSNEGVTFFKPLVNAMNSAILGISSIDKRFNRCAISLTFDHRVTEGKQIALFLQELKNRIESYRSKYVDVNIEVSCFKCMKSLDEDLSDTGFAKCITPKGEEAYICQSCFKGF